MINLNKEKLIPVIIISLTVILSAIFISRTGIYIKNTGGAESGGKISNTISVSGDGKVSAKPDMVQLNIGFQEKASTSKEALAKVNSKIDSALKILKDNGISDSDITTSNLNVYTEYDYSTASRRIIGQQASETLEVKIKKIDDKATRAVNIIDELSTIDNLQMNGIYFDIEDKTELFSKARELAFNKAQQKAQELAKLSKVKLAKPVSISDSTYDVTPVSYSTNIANFKTASTARNEASDISSISSGQMDITANLSILWGIE
ncbi:MAG: SIMPL domain-containing protein [Candidatus Shapirobacteria bacterium]|nr:SIMPL domain-containing protein [Candidatus Shapirobacteria bacterium]MDD4410089.1 SIMPL domain-containing protein [Candidatus Shapirobacteria bacterium]